MIRFEEVLEFWFGKPDSEDYVQPRQVWLSVFVGWALPTTTSMAVVKISINSLLTPCS